MRDETQAVQAGPHYPKGSPKQEGKRWEMGVLGAPLCRGSPELSTQLPPGLAPAPSRHSGMLGGGLWGIYGEIGSTPPGSSPPTAHSQREGARLQVSGSGNECKQWEQSGEENTEWFSA